MVTFGVDEVKIKWAGFRDKGYFYGSRSEEHMMKIATGIALITVFAACNGPVTKQTNTTAAPERARDVHTLSNADSISLQHLDLDVKVDMDARQIAGNATWAIDNKTNAKELRLDTYDLTIDSVLVDGKPVSHTLDAQIQFLGSALHIPVSGGSKVVGVHYHTGKNARALQWLDPQQTLDKKHPFLYTQSESIYARSWIPCADGPGIRFSYSARVTVPKGLMALMSAENPQQVSDSGVYHFNMEVPIPAYLMALAVGDITFKSIDTRTGVYAEPGMIARARNEFEDVGKMVQTAEQLYGPYRWGRYDVLVLPPGFPIGGDGKPQVNLLHAYSYSGRPVAGGA